MSLGGVLREHHVLQRLRGSRALRPLLHAADRPLWAHVAGVSGRCRVRAVQHASYYMVRGGPEPQVAATVRRVCDVLQPTTFLDVGANFGYYTWLVAELLPSAQVHSFEPDPANVALLRETLMRRGLQDRVTVHPAAVGETPGRSTFATDAMTGHRGHLTAVGDLEVPVVTLDSLDLRGPVLVKIDVEGGETEVLAGAQGLVESGVVFVVEAGAGSLARSLLAAAAYSLLDARTLAPLSDQSFEILAAPPALLERFV